MLADMTVKEFLSQTASSEPVPGGGSVAAMSAATAAALTEMVANLTIGRKKYEAVEQEMAEVAGIASRLRLKLIEDIDRDSDAFKEVMAAFKMPKDTEEEIESRKKAIQDATKKASLVPLEVAKEAYNMMDVIAKVVEKGNQNAVTDGAVAAMMARTAVRSALYNVKINLGSIKDESFVAEITEEVKTLESKIDTMEKDILAKVVL